MPAGKRIPWLPALLGRPSLTGLGTLQVCFILPSGCMPSKTSLQMGFYFQNSKARENEGTWTSDMDISGWCSTENSYIKAPDMGLLPQL